SIAGLGAGLAAIVIVGSLTWVMWPTLSDAEDKPASVQSAVNQTPAPTPATAPATPAVPDTGQAPVTAETPAASPLDGLRISSQSWRRGGLGSKALVTFT